MNLHRFIVILLVQLHLWLQHTKCEVLNFNDSRKAIFKAEALLMTGGRLQLTEGEKQANKILMKHKLEELAWGFANSNKNAAGLHFFKAKPLIEKSWVFKFLKEMPKGAVLHLHTTAAVSSKWFVETLSYMEGLLRCVNAKGNSVLSFRESREYHKCTSAYVCVNKEREKSASVKTYNENFEKLINLYTPVPEIDYRTLDGVWNKFEAMFDTKGDAILYKPAFRAYLTQMLKEMYDDNIMYAELRMAFKPMYDNSGATYTKEQSVHEFLDVLKKFKIKYPNFLGVKVIMTTYRGKPKEAIKKEIQNFKNLQKLFPNFIIGYDLVGQEDTGTPLMEFIDILTDGRGRTKYFFHAGETNWFGASTDNNLIDAVLLNTTRIGHGYALVKHPVLMNTVKQRKIAIEVSPISNQVLNLVSDMRNHPGAVFLAQNIPIVICNDDPGLWNAKGISYDYYYVLMSMASKNAGLGLLKTLVWDSLRYSVLTPDEYKRALSRLEKDWYLFINKVLTGKLNIKNG